MTGDVTDKPGAWKHFRSHVHTEVSKAKCARLLPGTQARTVLKSSSHTKAIGVFKGAVWGSATLEQPLSSTNPDQGCPEPPEAALAHLREHFPFQGTDPTLMPVTSLVLEKGHSTLNMSNFLLSYSSHYIPDHPEESHKWFSLVRSPICYLSSNQQGTG